MVSGYFTSGTRIIFFSRLLVRVVKSGGLLFVPLLIPGLSCPSIITSTQSRESVTSEALTAGVGVSGAIDATAAHAFLNAGPEVAADTRISEEQRPDESQRLLLQRSATHPDHREISSFCLLVIVMIFALFIELTGNRFR
jgi:hypothetical protein